MLRAVTTLAHGAITCDLQVPHTCLEGDLGHCLATLKHQRHGNAPTCWISHTTAPWKTISKLPLPFFLGPWDHGPSWPHLIDILRDLTLQKHSTSTANLPEPSKGASLKQHQRRKYAQRWEKIMENAPMNLCSDLGLAKPLTSLGQATLEPPTIRIELEPEWTGFNALNLGHETRDQQKIHQK